MKRLLKKIAALIITLFFISLITFLAFQVIPGDHALVSLGTDATKEQVEALREARGLNQGIHKRYFQWLIKALRGEFGDSLSFSLPVKELVGSRMPVTIGLGILSLVLILVVSLPLGLLSAKGEGKIADRSIAFINQLGMAVPPFFLGILLMLLFGVMLKWFVPGGYISPKESMGGYLNYMIYPAIAIAVPKIAMMVKFLRSSVLRQLTSDYVRTAKGKGSSDSRILYGHVLKNALIPVVTFFGMIAADVLAGSMILEQVFNLPGLGRLLVVSISSRDYPVVQAVVLYMAVLVLLINFFVDMIYGYLDPRMEGEIIS